MQEARWRFIANQNSTIYGINDAGIETFTSNVLNSLVRETIQNSLDACLDEKKPIRVVFDKFKMEKEKYPDIKNYRNILIKCLKSNKGENDAEIFFKRAIETIDNDNINIMRISDYNTIGLKGADTGEKGTPWSRLVKENGSSNKTQTSGGSFGIGKSAAFACSNLRTVFYSSLDMNEIQSYIGVARLVSFIEPSFVNESNDGWTTGIGFFSDNEKLHAILEQVNFDDKYNRREYGTDLYIMGFVDDKNWKNKIIVAVLRNFLVSIWKGKLIVEVGEIVINQETLNAIISNLNEHESEDIKQIINYYTLLSQNNSNIKKIVLSSEEYGKKYNFNDGECTLLLMEGENLNSRIMMTRKAGMRLFDQNHISGTIDFTGILMIEGENMNQAFKKMEVPSHDAWEPGRCKGEEKKAKDIYDDLRRYLRKKVKESFAKPVKQTIDAFGANDFLPDNIIGNGKKTNIKETLTGVVKDIKTKDIVPTRKSKRRIETDDINPDDKGKNGNKKDGEGKHSEKQGNHYPKDDDGNEKGFKIVDVKSRIICIDKDKGLYLIKYIVPRKVKRVKLEFILNGEQSDYDFPVNDVWVESGKVSVDKIDGNNVYLSNIEKNDKVILKLNLKFNQYCMMEANYYENKK